MAQNPKEAAARLTSTGRQLVVVSAPSPDGEGRKTPRYDRYEMSDATHSVVKAAANAGIARLHRILTDNEEFDKLPIQMQLRAIELATARAYGTIPNAAALAKERDAAEDETPAEKTRRINMSDMLRSMASRIEKPELVRSRVNDDEKTDRSA